MNKSGSFISSVRSNWLMLGVAGLLIAGAQSASAQSFGDFETGIDGFYPSDNSTRTTIVAGVTNYLNVVTNETLPSFATSGSNVLSLVQQRETDGTDNFDWSLEVNGLSNATFAAAISNAVMDTNALYDVFYEGIYDPAGFPGAGTSNGPTYINHLNALIVPAEWVSSGSVGPTGAQLGENFTNTFTIEHGFRVEDYGNMTEANIAAASNNVSLLISLNGNWDTTGVENAATMYYDNFRVVEWDPFLFDFEVDEQGWFDGGCASSVFQVEDNPDTGFNTLQFSVIGGVACAGASVIMTPGQHAYEIVRNLVRYQDPDDFVLKLDYIIDTSVLSGSPKPSFFRPMLGFELTTYEEVSVVDTNTMTTNTYFTNVVTELPVNIYTDQEILVANLDPGITVVPLELPLNVFNWPNDYQYSPVSIRMNLGHELDASGFPTPNNRVWFDNIAIGEYRPPVPEKTVITSITKSPSDTTVTWVSEPNDTNFFGIVSPVYYGIQKSIDLEGDIWGPVASNLLSTYPAEGSHTFASAGPDEEYYRVDASYDFLILKTLYSFENFSNDVEHWSGGPLITNQYDYIVTNSSLVASSGSNSLQFTANVINPPAADGNYWAVNVGIPSGSVQYLEILDALNDSSNEYFFSFDVIYEQNSVTSNPTWFQVPFAFQSDTGGWQQSGEAGGPWIPDFLADTNTQELVWTFSKPLDDANWTEHTTTNDFWTIFLGAQGGGSTTWTNFTIFFDNVRLGNVNFSE